MAIGAMNSAFEAGVSIPKQLAIIGCGNLHYDDSLRVPLLSIDQKSERIGERAAEIILERVIRGKYDEKEAQHVVEIVWNAPEEKVPVIKKEDSQGSRRDRHLILTRSFGPVIGCNRRGDQHREHPFTNPFSR
jgi:hypothetical protein